MSFSASAAALVADGVAPGTGAGWTALAGLSFGTGDARKAPTVRVGLADVLPRAVQGAAGTATFDWVAAIAEVCPVGIAVLGRGRIAPCAMAEYGVLRASGSNTLNPVTVSRPWLALGTTLRVGWRIYGPLSVEVAGGGLFTLERNRFTLAAQDVFDVPEVVARATAGLGLALP